MHPQPPHAPLPSRRRPRSPWKSAMVLGEARRPRGVACSRKAEAIRLGGSAARAGARRGAVPPSISKDVEELQLAVEDVAGDGMLRRRVEAQGDKAAEEDVQSLRGGRPLPTTSTLPRSGDWSLYFRRLHSSRLRLPIASHSKGRIVLAESRRPIFLSPACLISGEILWSTGSQISARVEGGSGQGRRWVVAARHAEVAG
jgi:hypothetical protein